MTTLFAILAHHAYAALALVLFITCCGLPLPVSVALMTAGAQAHHGILHLPLVLAVATLAALAGDTILYLGGRYTGWWLLAGLCRASINPEACIFESARQFYRRGARTLLIAKFIPGLATVAAPLAGSLNMRLRRFLLLDTAGVLLYVSAWTMTGFVFAPLLKDILRELARAAHVSMLLLGIAIGAYLAWLVGSWFRDAHLSKVEKIAAQVLLERLRAEQEDKLVIIADVRSHGYYDPGTMRIKNSIRVEPSRLKEELAALRDFMQPECEIYLYCSCANEATSVRVARMLAEESYSTKVIRGGMRAWVRAGGPLEPVPPGDVERLPKFD